MNNKKTIKKILIGLVIAIALLVIYSIIAPKDNSTSSSQNSLSSLLGSSALGQIEETDVGLANAEILKILGSIQHIELRDDIFTNPIFRELKDTHFVIPKPTRIGRANPFLPIGFDIIEDNFGEFDSGDENLDDEFFDDLFGDFDFGDDGQIDIPIS